MPNESPARCAERAPDGQLFRAQCGAAKLHVHHVHARDQQNENDRGQHRPDDLAKLHAGERVQQRLHARRREILVRLRIVFGQMPRNRDHLRIRLIDSDAGFQTAHHCGRAIVGAKEEAAPRRRRELIIERGPEFLRERELKAGRHDTNDRCRFTVNSNTLSNDVRVGAEIASPDFVPENRHLFCTGLIVFGGKVATHHRRHADDLEHVFGDITAGVALRIVFVSDVDCRSTQVAGHHRKRFLRGFDVFVILRGRNIAVAEVIVLIARLGIDQTDAYELFRMRKRKSAEHDRVDHGELRGRAADAESEDQGGEKTKRFLFEQHAQSDAHILPK